MLSQSFDAGNLNNASEANSSSTGSRVGVRACRGCGCEHDGSDAVAARIVHLQEYYCNSVNQWKLDIVSNSELYIDTTSGVC